MIAIIISIKPKWVAKILNGEKTIEVRRKFPKDYKGWVYIYCTKSNKYECLEYADNPNKNKEGMWVVTRGYPYANGKVVARFYCDKVEEIECYEHHEPECDIGIGILPEFTCNAYRTNTLGHFELLEKSCLQDLSISSAEHVDELDLYLKGNTGYAIHISQLEIFDEPKELSEFRVFPKLKSIETDEDFYLFTYGKPLTKAPQNYCYMEADE